MRYLGYLAIWVYGKLEELFMWVMDHGKEQGTEGSGKGAESGGSTTDDHG